MTVSPELSQVIGVLLARAQGDIVKLTKDADRKIEERVKVLKGYEMFPEIEDINLLVRRALTMRR